ncbi:MAG: aminopeptidase N [bacterium]
MKSEAPKTIRLQDYTPPIFEVDSIDLRFELHEDHTQVTATQRLRRRTGQEGPLVLEGQELELRSIALDGEALAKSKYRLSDTHLTIPEVPDTFMLQVVVHIHPEKNTALEGLYRSGGMFCTQCEAEGFRKITYFQDRPDVMTVFSTTVEADRNKFPVLLSNGNPVESGESGGGRHWVRWEDPFRKPSYLFALVAGDLGVLEDSFLTCSGRQVALRIYSEHENVPRLGYAMESLQQSMKWDEERFGREYDLDIYMIVAVNDFNFGAMENKGLNLFNAKYVLADPESATDSDFYHIQAVIAHEYFHNWTGNRVTCRDWFQLSLKEGLTVFRDQEFSSDLNSRPVKRIDDVNILRNHQFPEDSGPMSHPVRPDAYQEINNFYTATVYEKGAEVIRMMHNLLGREGFRKGMDLYFERHDGQAVTCDDFVAALEDANQVDFQQFRRWYAQSGTPELRVTGAHAADAQTYTLMVEQSVPDTVKQNGFGFSAQQQAGADALQKQAYHLPLEVGLLSSSGAPFGLTLQGTNAPEVESLVLQVQEERQEFVFAGIPEPPVPSLLRGFSAPVKLHFEYSDSDLAFLMAHDPDLFNRWEAGQQLMIRIALQQVKRVQSGLAVELPEVLRTALGQLLGSAHAMDAALLAQALAFPDERYLGEQMDVVAVEEIHAVRTELLKQLAHGFAEELRELYRSLNAPEPYRPDAAGMGRRALKNRCLGLLTTLDQEETRQLAYGQFRNATNMTEASGALMALNHLHCREREQALAAFYERWQNDPLVITKWFTLQAMSALPDTLKNVRHLLAHPSFDLKNPNKARALIGAFAHSNPVRFHEASGQGYAFLAEQVIALNSLNPTIAARLVGAFNQWKRFDPKRQELMKTQLEAVIRLPQLSGEVHEVVSRALNRG